MVKMAGKGETCVWAELERKVVPHLHNTAEDHGFVPVLWGVP